MFAPLRIRVPAPDLVKLPGPVMPAPKVTVRPGSTCHVPPFAPRKIAPSPPVPKLWVTEERNVAPSRN